MNQIALLGLRNSECCAILFVQHHRTLRSEASYQHVFVSVVNITTSRAEDFQHKGPSDHYISMNGAIETEGDYLPKSNYQG